MLSHLVPSKETCGNPALRYAISNPHAPAQDSPATTTAAMENLDHIDAFVSHPSVLNSSTEYPPQQLITVTMSHYSELYTNSHNYHCARGSGTSSIDQHQVTDDGVHASATHKHSKGVPLSHQQQHHSPFRKSDSGNTQVNHGKTSHTSRSKVATSPRYDSRNCCFCCISKQSTKGNNSSPSESNDNASKAGGVSNERMKLEDVRSWGDSFDCLMNSVAGREIFRDFLKLEYSEENILFWLACEDLHQERNQDMIEEKARLIYEDYISILSPKEVSLDSRAREIINANMLHPSLTTFDEAQSQIYTLMQRDSYPRFINSRVYRECLKNAAADSVEDERQTDEIRNPP